MSWNRSSSAQSVHEPSGPARATAPEARVAILFGVFGPGRLGIAGKTEDNHQLVALGSATACFL